MFARDLESYVFKKKERFEDMILFYKTYHYRMEWAQERAFGQFSKCGALHQPHRITWEAVKTQIRSPPDLLNETPWGVS